MKPIEAELMKYFSNSYKAMRVTFANAFYRLCKEVDANYDVVKDAFLFHGVGDGHYLRVNKQFGGFGGTCLPKDTKGLANLVDDLGLDIEIFRTIVEDNERFTSENQEERFEI
jgi:UDPglucose 6-dehydrogenase